MTPKEPSPTLEESKVTNRDIGLFDSVPPPDDCQDWDTKSDSLSDTDDYQPYHGQENFTRSSIFDDEPPSLVLVPNESSGIVKDYSTTR